MNKTSVLAIVIVITNLTVEYLNYNLKPSVRIKEDIQRSDGKIISVFGVYKGRAETESITKGKQDPIYKLRGVIISSEKTAAIIDEGSEKSHIVEVGENLNNAKVLKISEKRVVIKSGGSTTIIEIREPTTAEYTPELISIEPLDAEAPENKYEISKEKIKMYMSNVKEVWKNILFSRKGGMVRVSYLNDKGEFANLGLRKGDEILTIDDEVLSTFKLLELYRNSEELEHLKLGVKRGCTIIELNYEIK